MGSEIQSNNKKSLLFDYIIKDETMLFISTEKIPKLSKFMAKLMIF
jgi:hypothetical protein